MKVMRKRGGGEAREEEGGEGEGGEGGGERGAYNWGDSDEEVYDAEGDAQPQRKRKSRQQQRSLEFSEENDEEELTIGSVFGTSKSKDMLGAHF